MGGGNSGEKEGLERGKTLGLAGVKKAGDFPLLQFGH